MALLKEARVDNEKRGVTGLLLYHNQSFMQVIEGEEETVRHLYYEGIFHDNRHTAVHALINEPITERRYKGWSMGFRNIEGKDFENLDGFVPIPEGGLNEEAFKDHPDIADRFMESFSASEI